MCSILNDNDQRSKLDAKCYKVVFLGYSTNSRADRGFNKCKKTVMESINAVVDDVEADMTTELDQGGLLEFEIEK